MARIVFFVLFLTILWPLMQIQTSYLQKNSSRWPRWTSGRSIEVKNKEIHIWPALFAPEFAMATICPEFFFQIIISYCVSTVDETSLYEMFSSVLILKM